MQGVIPRRRWVRENLQLHTEQSTLNYHPISSPKREVKNKIQDYSPFRPVQNSSDNSWLTGSGEDTVNAYLQRHLCQLRSDYLSHFSLRSISRESIENVVFIDCLNDARGYFKHVLLEREGISQEQLNHF